MTSSLDQQKFVKNLEFFSGIALRIEGEVNELKFWIKSQYDDICSYKNIDCSTNCDNLVSILGNVNVNGTTEANFDVSRNSNDENDNFDGQQNSNDMTYDETSSQNSQIDDNELDQKPIIVDSFSIVDVQVVENDQDPLSLPPNFKKFENVEMTVTYNNQEDQEDYFLNQNNQFLSSGPSSSLKKVIKRSSSYTSNSNSSSTSTKRHSIPTQKIKDNYDRSTNSTPLTLTLGKKTRTCKVCRKKSTNLKRHMETHSVGQVYDCEYCHFKFRTKNSHEVHLRQYHRKQLTHYPFKCHIPECAMYFMLKSALDDHHQVVHVGLLCQFCELIFNDKALYKEHVERVHLMCGNLSCTAPGPYSTRNDFHIHKMTHRKKFC